MTAAPAPRRSVERPVTAAELTAVVVSYERPDLLSRCLVSLVSQDGLAFDVIVVDNASSDAGVRALVSRFPTVRWVFNDTNVGFAAACNQALRCTSASRLLTLNNDVELRPGFLRALADAAPDGSRIGMVASVLLRHDDPARVDSAGFAIDRAGISWERFAGRGVEGVSDWCGAPRLLGPVGGAALYRRDMLDDVGGFDEGLHMYHEDLDLAWRARNAGWECGLAVGARVLHHHSATVGRESPLKRFHLARNKLLVIVANYPTPALYAYLPMIVAYDVLSVAWYVAVARGEVTLGSRAAVVHGRLAALLLVPGAVARRRARTRLLRLSPANAFALLAPPVPPWRVRSRFAH
jgi:hypothetical protein